VQRHETDAVALTFALIFLGIATGWLMVAAGAADVEGLRYFFPVLLLGAGGAGVLASLLRRPARAAAHGTADAPETVVDTAGGQP
jgi:hypothetical protein